MIEPINRHTHGCFGSSPQQWSKLQGRPLVAWKFCQYPRPGSRIDPGDRLVELEWGPSIKFKATYPCCAISSNFSFTRLIRASTSSGERLKFSIANAYTLTQGTRM